MNGGVQPIAPRGPHGGVRSIRPGQSVSDDDVIGAWQLFRRTVGVVDGRLAASLIEGDRQPGIFYEVLAKLAASTDRMLPMYELAATVAITSGGLTRLVDRLVHAGLVEREYSTEDRRVVYAVLTDKGAAHEVRSTLAYVEQLRRDFESLGPDGLRALGAVCRHIQAGFGEQEDVGVRSSSDGRAGRGHGRG